MLQVREIEPPMQRRDGRRIDEGGAGVSLKVKVGVDHVEFAVVGPPVDLAQGDRPVRQIVADLVEAPERGVDGGNQAGSGGRVTAGEERYLVATADQLLSQE